MVRGVLYTALTRARELLVVVGDDAAIRSMAANDRQQRRYSGLKWRLSHESGLHGELRKERRHKRLSLFFIHTK